MQYVFNERREYIQTIEFKNTNPILNVDKINNFQEEGLVGTIVKKEFRYSFNNVQWQPWTTLTKANLSSISFNDNKNFYLHVKFTRSNVAAGNIAAFYLIYTSKTPSQDDEDYGEVNYGVNVGDGDASVYFGKSGEALQFREIKGTGSISVSTSDNIIIIDSSGGGSGTYDTTLDASLEVPNSVGGIPAGTKVSDLKGDTFIQLFDSLLFPTVNPTYVTPNNSFVDNVNNLQEIGASINITFTAGFDRGQILLSSVFQNYRSGLPNTYNYTGSGLPVTAASTSLYNIQSIIAYAVIQGTQSWTNTVSYDEGPQPYNNKGNPYGSPLAAGTTSSKSTSLEGVYPFFATTISLTASQQPLVSFSANPTPNISGWVLVAEDGVNKQKFATPNARGILSGIKNFNPLALPPNDWYYEGGNAATSLALWTASASTNTIQGNLVTYTLYTYNGPNRGTMTIRLEF